MQTERRQWMPDIALAPLHPLESDVCKYMENREVWERIYFAVTICASKWAWLPLIKPQWLLFCCAISVFGISSVLDSQHEQVKLGSNRSITMNRAPSSVACRVWESCWEVFFLTMKHNHVGCVCWLYVPCKVFLPSWDTRATEELVSCQSQTKELN